MIKKIIAVILAAVLLTVSFTACSGKASNEGANAVKVGETEYNINELNYMYVNVLNDIYDNLYRYYGSALSSLLDLEKPLSEQDMGDGTTWHEYLTDYTVENLKGVTALYEKAVAEGFKLSEEDSEMLANLEADFETAAAEYGTDMAEFIEAMYGKGIDFDTVYKMTEMRLLAGSYADAKAAEMTATEEEMLARYESDKNSFDTVDFRFYNTYYGENENYTDEDVAACKAEAEAFANVKTEEEFKALAIERAPEDEKEAYEEDGMTLFSGAAYDKVGIEEIAAWLFEEGRTYGDTYIYEDETYGGFITVFFVERNDVNYTLKNVRHILVMPEAGEDKTVSAEAWSAAEQKANELLNEFLSGSATEDDFAAMAAEHSEDPGSAQNGGLYENITKGKMVAPFEGWCFEEGRKPGDTGIVKTNYGYHIMYFSADGESALSSAMEKIVLGEKFDEWINSITEDMEVEKYEDFDKIGSVIEDIVAAARKYAEKQMAANAESSGSSAEGQSENSSEE